MKKEIPQGILNTLGIIGIVLGLVGIVLAILKILGIF
jgi:hypothetical protein